MEASTCCPRVRTGYDTQFLNELSIYHPVRFQGRRRPRPIIADCGCCGSGEKSGPAAPFFEPVLSPRVFDGVDVTQQAKERLRR